MRAFIKLKIWAIDKHENEYRPTFINKENMKQPKEKDSSDDESTATCEQDFEFDTLASSDDKIESLSVTKLYIGTPEQQQESLTGGGCDSVPMLRTSIANRASN